MRVLVLHGPNLHLLGRRNPAVYGQDSLADIDLTLRQEGNALGVAVVSFQSNSEADLLDRLGRAPDEVAGVVINPGGLGHTSVALRDAIEYVRERGVPVVEVHLSNVFARETFRQPLTAGAASGVIAGLGARSYRLGLRAVVEMAGAPRIEVNHDIDQ